MERQLIKLNSELSMINQKLERLINIMVKSAKQIESKETQPCNNCQGCGCTTCDGFGSHKTI